MSSASIRRARVAFVAMALICVPNASVATAMFSSMAFGRLQIESVSGADIGLFINGMSVETPFVDAFGLANADSIADALVDAVNPAALTVGEGLSQRARANGVANGDGTAFADTQTIGEIFIDNGTLDDVVVSFALTYALSALSVVTNPVIEFASAFGQISVFGESVDRLGVRLVDVFDVVSTDSDLGDVLIEVGDTLLFDVTVFAGNSELIVAEVNAFGFAASALPERMPLALLCLGLALAGKQRMARLGCR